MLRSCTLLLTAGVALAAPSSSLQPPCHDPAYPGLETFCYTVVKSTGNFYVIDVGYGQADGLMTSFGGYPSNNFTSGTTEATSYVIAYFSYFNIPRTTPLIFRPSGNIGWLASFPIPTSLYPNPDSVPAPDGGTEVELFTPKRLATYRFTTDGLATADNYTAACATLSSYIQAGAYDPVDGAWDVAWVTYDPLAVTVGRVNACWIQVEA